MSIEKKIKLGLKKISNFLLFGPKALHERLEKMIMGHTPVQFFSKKKKLVWDVSLAKNIMVGPNSLAQSINPFFKFELGHKPA